MTRPLLPYFNSLSKLVGPHLSLPALAKLIRDREQREETEQKDTEQKKGKKKEKKSEQKGTTSTEQHTQLAHNRTGMHSALSIFFFVCGVAFSF